MKEKHKKIIVNKLNKYIEKPLFKYDIKDYILRFMILILLTVASYYLGMYRINIDCIKHEVKYQSNQNHQFYWYDEFHKAGIDKREVN